MSFQCFLSFCFCFLLLLCAFYCSYPTSSTKRRDWDALERQIQEEEKSDVGVGDEALNFLLKDIYSKADEDTRRAMIKSFQTSGGTVLSTNWNEVSDKDYTKELQAPKGMEWRKFE